MNIEILKSKIHRVKVTGADLNYIGSITIDNDLMDAAVAVNADDITISLAKSTQASSSTTFTGRYTTTKVKV